MRTRLTAALTASALAFGVITVPHAAATPEVSYRTSAHGQHLCTVAHGKEDQTAVNKLTQAYGATLQKASAAVQAKYPTYASTFAAVTSTVTPATMMDLVSFPALKAQLKKDGYNDADIAAIVLGASNAQSLIQNNLATTFLHSYPEASINRAQQYLDATATTPQAPLLSDGTSYSSAFTTDLRAAEASTDLSGAIAAFDATAGNAAMRKTWSKCIAELQSRGMTLGEQEVPEVPVPIYDNNGTTGSSSSTQIILLILGISVLTVGAAYVANGGLASLNVNLPFPLGA